MKLTALKEERYINEIAPRDTKMYLEVMFWSRESFVGLYFLNLDNETFSQHHLHNNLEQFLILSAFLKILKTARMTFLKREPCIPNIVINCIPKFH